jgi:glycosyltransferase involved in cell wall biosynthesis
MAPFFSIVIPLYNKENFIPKTLESVLAQNFSDFEIIVIDDGSTDGGPQMVKKIEDPRVELLHQENQGVSTARNKGVSHAKGKYIALLDADDYWYPMHLEELKKLIELFPKAGLYCNSYELFFENGMTQKAVHDTDTNKPQLVPDYFEASSINAIAWTSAVCFSKKVFDEIGGFDMKIRSGQDVDFFIRAALKVKVAFNPVVTVRYNKTTENNLAKSHFNEGRIYLLNKYKTEENQNPSLKKYLDLNRYSVALRCKLQNMPEWKKLVSEIKPENLNAKQRFLLKMPKDFLKSAIRFQRFLMKKGVYWTAFK